MPTMRSAQEIVNDVLAELRDPNGIRWAHNRILAWITTAVNEISELQVFTRVDLLVPTAGQSSFYLSASPFQIDKVKVGGTTLSKQQYEARGRGDTPFLYIPDTVSTAGEAVTLAGSVTSPPSDVRAQGPEGSGYWAWRDGTTWRYFMPGDGIVTGWDGDRNVRVWYSYTPVDLTANHLLPRAMEEGLIQFACWRARRGSRDPVEVAAGNSNYQLWNREFQKMPAKLDKARIVGEPRRGNVTREIGL